MPATVLNTNQYISASLTFGDVKHGLQTVDHNGWIQLNGRAKSSLNANQQQRATDLGIGANLPDASNSYLSQDGGTLGTVNSSNNKTIARANLPNVTLGGISNTAGDHGHSFSYGESGTGTGRIQLTSTFNGVGAGEINNAGNHSHTITTDSINGNVTQTALNVKPQTLSVNTFIYLGT